MDELATHCKPGDYFIALYGQIIDVSNFISKHPGGEKILKANAGKDATQKFESIWVFAFVITFLFYVHSGSFMFLRQNFVITSLSYQVSFAGIHATSGGFDLISKWCPDSIVATLSDWKGPAPPILTARKYPGSLMLWPAVVVFAIAAGFT